MAKQPTKQMNETKTVEKEKIVAEKLNGRFAMIGFIALIGAYLTTGQIIQDLYKWILYLKNKDMYRSKWFLTYSLLQLF